MKSIKGVTPKSEISSSLTLYMWFYLLCPTVTAEPCYGVHVFLILPYSMGQNLLISLTPVIPLHNKSDSDRAT